MTDSLGFQGLTRAGNAIAGNEPGRVALAKGNTGNADPLVTNAAHELTIADATARTQIGATNEAAPGTDTSASGLNGRLQRLAQAFTALTALFPSTIGQKAKAASLAVTVASDDDLQGKLGALTETAPANDTASSGLNGRLQRVAQRLTSLIAQIPAALGQGTKAQSLTMTLASDDNLAVAVGAKTDAKSTATDATSVSAMSVWKQISASIQTLATLGQGNKAASQSVTLATNDDLVTAFGAQADAAAGTDTGTASQIALLKRLLGYLAGTNTALLGTNMRKVAGTDLESTSTGAGGIPVYFLDPATGLRAPINPSVAFTSDYPYGATPIGNSSGDKAATTASATLTHSSGKTLYLTEFDVTGSGATAASVVLVTVTGLAMGTRTYPLAVIAGASLQNPSLVVRFPKPLAAADQNTDIVVSCPSLGSGSAHNCVNASGYLL